MGPERTFTSRFLLSSVSYTTKSAFASKTASPSELGAGWGEVGYMRRKYVRGILTILLFTWGWDKTFAHHARNPSTGITSPFVNSACVASISESAGGDKSSKKCNSFRAYGRSSKDK